MCFLTHYSLKLSNSINKCVVLLLILPALPLALGLNLFNVGPSSARALEIYKSDEFSIKDNLTPVEKKACSFERIYFSRGSDSDIYKERKELGKLIMPTILKEINYDISNSVFSYIPNTAETSFYGMIESVEEY